MKHLVLIVTLVLVFVVGCSTGWEAESKVEPPEDLVESLLPVSYLQKYLHGDSERTRILLNLLTVTKFCQDHEIKIKAMEDTVAALEKRPDPTLRKETQE